MVKRVVVDPATARDAIRERCQAVLNKERPVGRSISASHRAAYKRHMDRFRFIMKRVNMCPSDELCVYHQRFADVVEGGVNPGGGFPIEGMRSI